MAASSPSAPCPCGRLDARRKPLSFAHCCGRFIGQAEPAPDAESLMRSRYSAFVLEDAAYLRATWHMSTRPGDIGFEPRARWLGLEVKWHRATDAGQAQVEFVARQRDASGRAIRLHERSRFVQEDGLWYYVDGDQLDT